MGAIHEVYTRMEKLCEEASTSEDMYTELARQQIAEDMERRGETVSYTADES